MMNSITKTRSARLSRSLALIFVTGLGLLGVSNRVFALALELRKVATGFIEPLFITHAGDGSGRLFVVEHAGAIRVIRDGKVLPTPFIDLGPKGLDRVSHFTEQANERGLLGLAFHPKYKENGSFYVFYTAVKDGSIVIAEYRVSPDNPDAALPSEKIILGPIKHSMWNHNGGMIAFGPDGFLYIGVGDGGLRADTGPGHTPKIGNGQDTTNLLGKILRIDVNTQDPPLAYGIPHDNPFATGAATAGSANRHEIYAWGIRNAWRFSFDRKTGRLFCGDVGQDLWEEVDIIEKGGNYGWRRMEGNHCFNPATDCQSPDLILPIHEYKHDEETGGLSITGGHVYRGKQYPLLEGVYVFADYASSRIWTLTEGAGGKWTSKQHLRPGYNIPSFGEDEAGELYLCSMFRGDIHQITAREGEPAPEKE